jgi:ribosome-associated protein
MTDNEFLSEPNKICLDQFLKLSSIAETGGHAKLMIQNGEVSVNGAPETRRRRKLIASDIVELDGRQFVVGDFLAFGE